MMLMTGLGSALASMGGTIGGTIGGALASPAAMTLGSLLQGGATVLGVMSSLDAGKSQAVNANLQARDAEAEIPQQTLQGIERRRAIRDDLVQAQGASDTAYAASGVDLSFGSAAQAREAAYRDTDLAETTDTGNEIIATSRLQERAANYRAAAKRSRRSGALDALYGGLSGGASLLMRGGPTTGKGS